MRITGFVNVCTICVGMLLSPPGWAGAPSGSLYLDGGDAKTALLLCHGRGKHPGWKVVDPLRKGVHRKQGWHTLSLQMPNADQPWRDYAEDFPRAFDVMAEGLRFLREERGVTRVFLMGHSMGARMASAFAAQQPGHGLAGLIVAGCRNNGGQPLACDTNLRAVRIPVLDIWGGNNDKDVDAAYDRQPLLTQRYRQVEIAGANHKFEGYEAEFVAAVNRWLGPVNTNWMPSVGPQIGPGKAH